MRRELRSVCVFCGSNVGVGSHYREVAATVGRTLAERGMRVVYGGGRVGLMGVVADAALAAGGEVTGVIPRALDQREVAHRGVTDLRIVETMHERKALMAELSDAFIALPGGYGTLDELCEILTWAQLGIHDKPVGLLDVDGFFDGLLAFFDTAMAAGFLRPEHRALLLRGAEIGALLEVMAGFAAPGVDKWVMGDG